VLNDVVQKLLDRIIFIRIAEDRKIRPERELWEIVAQWKAEGKRKSMMPALIDLFREVNDDLNGDIFKPHACESVEVGSDLLAEIVDSLYSPACRYRFDVIAVELLGSIYERYLGSTIRVTPQRVKVEEKPEVKKAGGVYYTPKFIVDYIVRNTVGKLIEGKTPKQIEKIKILDPACGSGSFLLGAYQYLIDYHLRYYREHPKDAQTLFLDIYTKVNPDDLALPLKEKANILRNNLFGVDIDAQAVEVTMMSLYLKALEGERGLLPRKQHLLPALGNNIKCGNSLVGYDIFDAPSPYPSHKGRGKASPSLSLHLKPSSPPVGEDRGEGDASKWGWTDEDKARINPFDWTSKTAGFGEIIENGGFDAVIGNPPYVRHELLGDFKDYFQQHYEVYHGTADLYTYFIEKGVSLLKKDGLFSYIVANKWMRAKYGEPLRRWMKKQRIEEITDFGDLPVFETATTYPCIVRIRKGAAANQFIATQVTTLDFGSLLDYVNKHSYSVNKTALNDRGWSLVDEQSQALLNKLQAVGKPLGEYVEGQIYRGILTGLMEAFVIDEKTKKQLIKEDRKSAELIKPFLLGKDVKRYDVPESSRYLILMPKGWTRERSGGTRGAWNWLLSNYPAIANHLKPFESAAEKRYDKGDYWWELRSCDYYSEFEKPKIMYAEIATRGQFTLDTEQLYCETTCYIIPVESKYLLAILNSSITTFIFSKTSSTISGGFYRWKRQYVETIPIRSIDFNNPSEKAIHDKLVSLVDRMIDLHKKKAALPPSAEREKIEREIAVTDEKIDEIVYGLYGVTDEERRII